MARKRTARKIAKKPAPSIIEASRTPLEDDGKASTVLPESANAAPLPDIPDESVPDPQPAIPNRDQPGSSKHMSVTLRKYEWLDLLDILEGSESVAVSCKRIETQIG